MAVADVYPPRAVSQPLMFQDWETLTFLHWRFNAELVRRSLPPRLELDTYDGTAWIGLTPFRVVDLHPPRLPAFPWMSHFPETNVRTYVLGPGGEPGIWFFSLEAARLMAVVGARTLYGLPYRWAKMRVTSYGDTVEYTSRRNPPWRPASSRLRIRFEEPVRAGELERFLTARFRLYTLLAGKLAFADVEHEPWPLRKAHIVSLEQDLLEACGLGPADGAPMVHYSPGVSVRIGRPELVR
jgi:uncharacterized protein YqjF (DUF2071 family)